MDLPFSGIYTRSELLNALKLHYRPSRGMIALRFLLMALVIVLYLGDPDLYQPVDVWAFVRALLPPIVGVLVIASPYLLPYGMLKQRQQEIDARAGITGRVTESGIVRTEQRTPPELQWKWAMFTGYKQRGDVLLLYYHTGAQYQIYSRSQFPSESDWQQFLELVRTNVKPKQSSL